ncbi:MAG: glycine cleavage system aminomethyltransferase GcvT [Candidatus Binatia bacterium]
MKRTPLHTTHRALGARFVDFGGWEMPVRYTSIVDEHRAVRQRVGLFDVSHMGEIELRGPTAIAVTQELTVNDLDRLHDGQAQYSLLCLPHGGVVDDVVVHRVTCARILLCVNASNTEKDFRWIVAHRDGVEVIDRSGDFAQLAVQGPRATEVLMRLTCLPLPDLPRFAFRQGEVAGCEALVSRTGYTGEDGWEIYCAPPDATVLWDAVLDAGAPFGITPAGLGARDTLRLECALPLYGHELTDETTPLEARLDWVVRFDKGKFIGRDALVRQRETGPARRLVGFVMTEPGIARPGYPIVHDGSVVGMVTSGTKSPTLGKAIGLGYVANTLEAVGTELGINIRGRVVGAEVVPLPFYKREG